MILLRHHPRARWFAGLLSVIGLMLGLAWLLLPRFSSGPPKINAGILALGDSYTIGEGVEPSAAWPFQLTRQLREAGFELDEPQIIARTGWATGDLLAQLNIAKPAGFYALVTLQIGVNNQYRGYDPADYRREFAELLRRAISYAMGRAERVLVLSFPDWGVTPFGAHDPRGKAEIGRQVDAFNAVAAEETARQQAVWIDITPGSRAAAQDVTLLAPDGLHPSAAMYTRWVEQALPAAREALKR